MSDYRPFFVPGGVSFFTLVNYRRRPLLARPCDLHRLREVVAFAQARATLPLLDGGGSSRPRALRGDGRRCPHHTVYNPVQTQMVGAAYPTAYTTRKLLTRLSSLPKDR